MTILESWGIINRFKIVSEHRD